MTENEINELKKKHGRVFVAKEGDKVAYFKKPSRKDLSYAMQLKDDPIAQTEVLLKSCHVGGDTCFYEEMEYVLGCDKLVEQLLSSKNVEVGEL